MPNLHHTPTPCAKPHPHQLTDTENVKQMNFSVFSKAFFVMTKATLQERLKLLFSLHCSKLTTSVSSPQSGAMATRSSVISLPSSDLDTG